MNNFSERTFLIALSFLFMGFLIVPFIFNIFLYAARRRKPEHLLFSLICLIVLLDLACTTAPALIQLPAAFIDVQFYIYSANTLLFSILFPAFFIYFFLFQRRLILPAILPGIIVMVLFTNRSNVFSTMALTVLIVSSVLAAWAVKEKRENSILILSGIAAAWISFLFGMAFIGLASVMVICVSISIARQFAKSEKAQAESELKSARLEIELLKKNINPHFLLNTLTSVIAWLRKDPESAVKLVESLALEFRMINQISALKLIPVNQEIELCRTHLQIMNYRRKSCFTLETAGLKENEMVPPMILLTLIENGLTHGYENKVEGRFIFRRTEQLKGIQYYLLNDGELNESGRPGSPGVGFSYIKGRLEEAYPGRWSFSSHHTGEGWETVIEIRRK